MFAKALFFDLDNTLHDFTRTSGIAMNSVYDHVHAKHRIDTEHQRAEYARIFQEAEVRGFFHGLSGIEYRAERFEALQNAFGIDDSDLVQELLNIYAAQMEANWQLFFGVEEMLGRLKEQFKLFIVTDGPQDSQEKAVEVLGLVPYFVDMYTSGKAGKPKADGTLYLHSISQSGFASYELIHIGDSYERDVLGASREGIATIWFNRKNETLDDSQKKPNAIITDLSELEECVKRLSTC